MLKLGWLRMAEQATPQRQLASALHLRTTPQGLRAIFTAPAQAEIAFALVDHSGETSNLLHEEVRSVEARGLNLLGSSGGARPGWRRRGYARGVSVGVNFSEGWRLDDVETAFLRTTAARPSALALADAVPLIAGERYGFSLLVASHRCRAAVQLDVQDARGRTLESLQRGVSAVYKGGRHRGDYDLTELRFDAPREGRSVAASVLNGGVAKGEDGFVFVAEPALWPAGEHELLLDDVPTETQAIWAQGLRGGLVLRTARLPLPAATEPDRVGLSVGGRLAAEAPVPSPLQTPPAARVETAPLAAASLYNRRPDSDGRRIAAVLGWLSKGPDVQLPDLDELQRLIDQVGPEPGAGVTFPAAQAPRVTVVVRADQQDPGLLLRSLAALLLAANAAPFEVVVVAEAADAQPLCGNIYGVAFAKSPQEALEKSRAPFMVSLQCGWEPVAGWLDELLAAFGNFDGVAAAGPKLLAYDGVLMSAGADRSAGSGRLGQGGNPRDPAYGYVRRVDAVAPVLISRRAAGDAGLSLPIEPGSEPSACAALARCGGAVLYVPTAELWRLSGATADAGEARVAASTPVGEAPRPRVLFIDQEAPTVDMDAGGYASFQEMRLLQAVGCQVDFLPKNLAWMDRHTLGLQRAGVRCFYAPFVRDFDGFLRANAATYDLVFVVRYKVALLVQEALHGLATRPRLVLNLADLHFLRERREAEAGTPGYSAARALATQEAELRAIAGADLTLTYSPVEAEEIAQLAPDARVGLAPWTVTIRDQPIGNFQDTSGLLFLGGFGHPPNAEAVIRFVDQVMPRLTERLPAMALRIVGSKATPEVLSLAAPNVDVVGYVADLDEAFASARIFVAPLLAGAGLKGKVVEAMARGVPMVLTSIAAEATGLTDGVDCLIADTPGEQVEAVVRLYSDEGLWSELAQASLRTARARFGFPQGVELMRRALVEVGVEPPPGLHMHYLHALPDRGHGASSAPAVLRLP